MSEIERGGRVKIYIETDMTELPKRCRDCSRLSTYGSSAIYEWGHYCGEAGFNDHISDLNHTRPDWCPLRTETEIADKKENE